MLSNISWDQYATFLSITLIAYYIVILSLFYRKDFLHYLSRFNNSTSDGAFDIIEQEKDKPAIVDSTDLNTLENELEAALQNGGKNKLIKEEIFLSLQLVLRNYHSLKFSPQKELINNYIIQGCEKLCSIHLDDENVNQLWL
ncbi:MAG: hypothetical protein M3015_08355 [Bacteroidota bacterium]|nr:hypothetical protein [Bacteroidota bacterium]